MLETPRLYIKPLTYEELRLYVDSEKDFADKSGYKPSASGIDGVTKEAIINALLPNLEKSKDNFEFFTMWIIIEKETLSIIGGLCFHGLPDDCGEVEIGYGMDITCRNKGYITEAIKRLIEWTGKSQKVKTIKAETENENVSSSKVLEKNGFKLCEKKNNTSLWRLIL